MTILIRPRPTERHARPIGSPPVSHPLAALAGAIIAIALSKVCAEAANILMVRSATWRPYVGRRRSESPSLQGLYP
jgi:hypothetical protein